MSVSYSVPLQSLFGPFESSVFSLLSWLVLFFKFRNFEDGCFLFVWPRVLCTCVYDNCPILSSAYPRHHPLHTLVRSPPILFHNSCPSGIYVLNFSLTVIAETACIPAKLCTCLAVACVCFSSHVSLHLLHTCAGPSCCHTA